MKKVFVLLLTLLIIFSLGACSTDKEEQPKNITSEENHEDKGAKEDKVDGAGQSASSDKEDTKKDVNSTVDRGKSNIINEEKIPEGYKKDLVPIVEGSEIYDGQKLEGYENTTYGLMCYSEEEQDYIVEFYKDVMKNAKGKTEGSLNPGSYYIDGTVENVKVYIVISEENGENYNEKYKSSFTITMELLGEDEVSVENEEGNSFFEFNEEGTEFPEGYPEDLVPLIKESKIIVSTKEDNDEGVLYWITAMTKQELKDVLDFYKNIMDDADDFSSVESSDMSFVSGVKDGADIVITILPEGADGYINTVNIVIEQLK